MTKALHESRSWAEAARRLGLSVSGASYRNLQAFARKNNVNVAHMKGQSWAKGTRKDPP